MAPSPQPMMEGQGWAAVLSSAWPASVHHLHHHAPPQAQNPFKKQSIND
eukprot:CAMPEP_0202892090 /NCGR_PEP_ID=MMETSP1392-20130828/1925_1 /ASSEMBLY_ACC=CAM_ASM_000868 /TAXON_ID=225041 /ORGANISM="Chlamydomonas chlamydogama, Strain SAG 11-48b" /LENGTH=48 /DNA_ID= /DNA_START= /DNA_END= /DNA_ORIENTATION=